MKILKDMKILKILPFILVSLLISGNAQSAEQGNSTTCEGKVEKLKFCCSAKGILSCLVQNQDKKLDHADFKSNLDKSDQSEALTWISKYIGGGTGALGLAAGTTVASSSFKKSCSVLEKLSYAYTTFNTIALGYCAWLRNDTKTTCQNAGKENHYTNNGREESKKELYAYVAKVGAGIYSAWQSNKCKKKLKAEDAAKSQQTAGALSKPAHCTSGLMVSYDSECRSYCSSVNNQDPVCQNVPNVPQNYASTGSYSPSRATQTRNRLYQNKLKKEQELEKKRLVERKIRNNKAYVSNTFKKMNEQMNQRLKAFKSKNR